MFGPQVAPQVKPMQINESALLLQDLLTNKDLTKNHAILRRCVLWGKNGDADLNAKFEFRYTASLMFYLAYGRRVKTLNDPLCMAHDLVEECE